jgi:hypothetical protein
MHGHVVPAWHGHRRNLSAGLIDATCVSTAGGGKQQLGIGNSTRAVKDTILHKEAAYVGDNDEVDEAIDVYTRNFPRIATTSC